MKLKDLAGDHRMQADISGQATAGTADEFIVGTAPFRATITGAFLVPETAVNGAVTNHITVTIRNRGAAGAGAVVPASKTFSNGVNAPALTATAVTLSSTSADLDIAEGDVITAEKLIVGTGMALPPGKVVVTFKAR